MNIAIPQSAVDFVNAGVIVLDIHVNVDGTSVSGRVLQPQKGGTIVPHIKYDLRDLLIRLGETEGTYIGPLKAGSGQANDAEIAQNEYRTHLKAARELVARQQLNIHTTHGVKNLLPESSLHVVDLNRKELFLQSRAYLVADKIGAVRMTSKIQADSTLKVVGAGNLHEWWKGSSSAQRWKLLTKRSVSGEAKGFSATFDTDPLLQIECPFQDPLSEMEALCGEVDYTSS